MLTIFTVLFMWFPWFDKITNLRYLSIDMLKCCNEVRIWFNPYFVLLSAQYYSNFYVYLMIITGNHYMMLLSGFIISRIHSSWDPLCSCSLSLIIWNRNSHKIFLRVIRHISFLFNFSTTRPMTNLKIVGW